MEGKREKSEKTRGGEAMEGNRREAKKNERKRSDGGE